MTATENQKADISSYDIVVIGGGINGAGVARDAAGRGLKVLLCEKGDLAGATSSASTKLIHGGLRYLERYEFRLVRESLQERETLWAIAPHIIRPLRFVLPHHSGLRPAWIIRLGLFLYDHLSGRVRLPGCRSLALRTDISGGPLKDIYTRAFEYSDLWVEDSRLVILNAMDAAERGADVCVQTEVVSARPQDGVWHITLCPNNGGGERQVQAKAVVNAAGPWAAEVLSGALGQNSRADVRLVKGSHIVVPRLFDHNRAYIFQHDDRRIIFAIPYEQDFTLIGTTDVDHAGAPGPVMIDEAEVRYLCDAVSTYFAAPVCPDDVVWSFAGLRPLYDDGAADARKVTRDYVINAHHPSDGTALVSVFGGKLTTYRRLAEEVIAALKPAFPGLTDPWTAGGPSLPGGDMDDFDACQDRLVKLYPGLPRPLLTRLARAYGTRTQELLDGVDTPADLGIDFGHGLTEREVAYVMDNEWAHHADDVLWRRSKLGLRLSSGEKEALSHWMAARQQAKTAPARNGIVRPAAAGAA